MTNEELTTIVSCIESVMFDEFGWIHDYSHARAIFDSCRSVKDDAAKEKYGMLLRGIEQRMLKKCRSEIKKCFPCKRGSKRGRMQKVMPLMGTLKALGKMSENGSVCE